MNTDAAIISWKVWLQWAGITILSLILGFVLFIVLGETLDNSPPWVFGLALGLWFGFLRATGQWLVLRRVLANIGSWIPLTVLAWVLFWTLNMIGVFGEAAESDVTGKILEGLFHGAIFGVFIGVAQWRILRERVTRARTWIAILAVCWAIAAATGDGLRAAIGPDFAGLDLLIAFGLADILSGFGIVWVLRQPAIQ